VTSVGIVVAVPQYNRALTWTCNKVCAQFSACMCVCHVLALVRYLVKVFVLATIGHLHQCGARQRGQG
jgi:hypothetical protein